MAEDPYREAKLILKSIPDAEIREALQKPSDPWSAFVQANLAKAEKSFEHRHPNLTAWFWLLVVIAVFAAPFFYPQVFAAACLLLLLWSLLDESSARSNQLARIESRLREL